MRTTLRLAFFAAAAALAACGGGGGSSSAPPVHPTPTPTPAAMGQAVITIDWPGASTASAMSAGQRSSHRAKASFISPGTAGVNIWVATAGNAAAYKTAIQNPCSSGTAVVNPSSHGANVARPESCTSTSTTVNVPIGANTFYAYSYDAWDSVNMKGTGNLLGATTSGSAITVAAPPSTNTVTLTMSGVVTSVNLSGFPISSGAGAGTYPATIQGLDATGNVISGTFANPVTLQFYDTHALWTVPGGTFPATVTQSGTVINFTKASGNDCTGRVISNASAYTDSQVSGGGVSNAAFQLMPDVNGGNTASANWFGRVRLCWNPLAGATTYYVYRGTSSGGESGTYIAALSGANASSWDDYTVKEGINYFYVICDTSTLGTPGSSTCDSEITYGQAPTDVTNVAGTPVYWFDANDTSKISGSTWYDKSGNGNNMTFTGFTGVSNAYNIPTRSALQSSAAGNYGYVSSGSLQASTAHPLTIFVVASQTGANGNSYQRLISLGYNTDGRGFIGTYGLTGSTYPGSVASFWGNTATSGYGNCGNTWCDTHANGPVTSWAYNLPQNVNYPAVFDVTNDGSCPATLCGTSSGLGGPLAYFNGGDGVTSDGVVAMHQDHNGTMTATTGMYVGATYSGGLYTSQYWVGLIDEIVVYNSTLSTAQQQEIEGYLACKWGAQYALPSAHPYSTGNGCP